MKNPLISIILPVYNTGEVLVKTFESIINQTYKHFELIIIDDGSDERTSSLCDKFVKMDDRVRIVHQKNLGTCYSRNEGIKMARGSYITFCDHDDQYHPELLKKEVGVINDFNYDLVITGKKYIYENSKEVFYGVSAYSKNTNDSKELFIKLIVEQISSTVWNILYKRELLEKVEFDIDMKKGQEDINFNFEICKFIKSVFSTNECLYFHYIRKNMSTSAKVHDETLISMEEVIKKAQDVLIDLKASKQLMNYVHSRLLRTYLMYSIKLGYDNRTIRGKLKHLYANRNKIKINELKNIDELIYFCVEKEKTFLLLMIIRIYIYLKSLGGV